MPVPLSGLRKMKIPLPPLSQQKDIVNKIERIFEKHSKAENSCMIINDKMESLSRSILSKAFRGELGTNDPIEEDAIELITEVLIK